MRTTLDPNELLDQESRLRKANLALARQYPGDGGARQPVHTVYGGAHLFRADTPAKLGALALRAMEEYAPDAASLAQATGMPGGVFAERVHARVVEKLRREPVEDYRIDFEDGYGHRAAAEEDADAGRTAREAAKAAAEGTLPPFIGIRVRPLDGDTAHRAVRTLDVFLTALAEATGGALPPGFVLTLPKVASAEQVDYFGDVLETLEMRLGWPRSLRFEIMVETPQSVVGPDGRIALSALVRAGGGRISGAHFGAYDYTAALGITAAHQHLGHQACDFARHAMQAALAGTGVHLSDGAVTVMPVPAHRAAPEGPPLTAAQVAENRAGVHRAWKTHFDAVSQALAQGFYQGWDLHPAQLVTRYAAVYAFFLAGVEPAAARLRNFVERAAQATRVGDAFDDAATGQGLLNFFLRAVQCGALSEAEATETTGLSIDELRGRSFARIAERRSPGGESDAESGAAGA